MVEIVTSHSEARGTLVRALRVDGIVAAATRNGGLQHVLQTALLEAQTALLEAQAAGVAVLRGTCCLNGSVTDAAGKSAALSLPSAGALTPVQARIELMLMPRLLVRRAA